MGETEPAYQWGSTVQKWNPLKYWDALVIMPCFLKFEDFYKSLSKVFQVGKYIVCSYSILVVFFRVRNLRLSSFYAQLIRTSRQPAIIPSKNVLGSSRFFTSPMFVASSPWLLLISCSFESRKVRFSCCVFFFPLWIWPHIDKHPNHLQQSIQACFDCSWLSYMCSNDLLWNMPDFGERSIIGRTPSFWCLNQLVQPISWLSPSSWWFSWLYKSATGWWFGTLFIFHNIRIILPNWLSYFSEGLKPPPPTSILLSLYICIEYHIPIVYPTSINQLVLGCNGLSKPSIFVAVNPRRIASPLVRLRPAGRSVPGRRCGVGLRRAAWGADGTCYAWPVCTRLISGKPGKHRIFFRCLVHK